MKERTHVDYFDNLRLFACLAVIFMHTAAGSLRQPIDGSWYATNFMTCLAFPAVPLFLMMSGYLLLTDEKTADVSVLFRHRLPKLLVPFLFWNVAAILWTLHLEDNLTVTGFVAKTVNGLHEPVMVHFWYLYTLIALYVLSPFLYAAMQNLSKSAHVLVFSLICLVSVQAMGRALVPEPFDRLFQIDLLQKMQLLGGHLCTFLLGYYLGTSEKRVPNWLLCTIGALCLAVITVGTWGLSKATGTYDQTFQSQNAGFEVVLAACIFLLFRQNCHRPLPRLLKPVVRLALPIYLSHNLFLSIAFSLGISVSSFGSILAVTALTFIVCFLGSLAASYMEPLAYLVTGSAYCRKRS